MTVSLGVLTPVTADPFSDKEIELLAAAVETGLADAVWVRDLPLVPAGDPDAGQGHDPFAHLAYLTGRGIRPAVVGTASVIIGTRHPLVVARAAIGAQVHSGGSFVLGLGSGGKAAMSAALGVDGLPLDDVESQWRRIRSALQGHAGEGLDLKVPQQYSPPPMWLASSDLEKWAALGDATEGWLTFLGSAEAMAATYAHIEAVRSDAHPLQVGVRVDLDLVGEAEAPARPAPTPRGLVRCSRSQVAAVLAPLHRIPVTHLLVGFRGGASLQDLWTVRESLPVSPSAPSSRARRGTVAAPARRR